MKIKLEHIEKAKKDQTVCTKIFNIVFYDKGKSKLRMWLVKKGINFNDIDDVEAIMYLVFLHTVNIYNNDKINFEKYVWVKFQQALNNFFFSKNHIKKNSMSVSLDEIIDNSSTGIVYNSGGKNYYEMNDIGLDFENIVSNMTADESFICKCKYFSDWTDSQIIEYINTFKNMTTDEYDLVMRSIRDVFTRYIRGEL